MYTILPSLQPATRKQDSEREMIRKNWPQHQTWRAQGSARQGKRFEIIKN